VDKPRLYTEKQIPQWGSASAVHRRQRNAAGRLPEAQAAAEEKFADFKAPEPFIPKSIGHWKEWIQACKTGQGTTCNFDYSGALTEANQLGNVAYRTGRKIEWDPVKLAAKNCPEAAHYVRGPYRKGWKLA